MEILFTIGGEEHLTKGDERLDKILITDADQITQQRAAEDAEKQKADPKFEPRPPVTAGMYAESITMPAVFDPLIKQQDDQRKAANAVEFDKADEKTKVILGEVNAKLVAAAASGDTAKVQKVADALEISIDKVSDVTKAVRKR